MQKLDILIVEDERSQREMLKGFLAKEGHHVAEARNGEEAIALVQSRSLDLAFVDFKMPGISGLEVLREIKRRNPEMDVILVTAYGTVETAVDAMKAGAADYITKPIDLEEMLLLIERVAERRTLVRENEMLRSQLQEKGITQDQIVFKSPKMSELINLAGRVAGSRASVLIQGESGTGKELFARLIHSLSPRSSKPLITVNCGALPESIIESELFGHERGAFTGAHQRRIGRFEQAEGGSLFLDEIGELSPVVQVRLLRFLQEGEYQRVGGNHVLRADVRVISATNRDLGEEVRKGGFREDLFFRLNVIAMKIPPLRERREDIPALIDHFLKAFARENRKKIEGTTREAKDLLMKYDYPGNVRELENIMERALVISRGPLISVEDLPFKDQGLKSVPAADAKGTLRKSIEALERRLVEEALASAAGNQTHAAAALGLSERMLRYKLKKYGLK
ncbi:MAG: sigma-54 dependent transcriptional regulator [Thermodesulfobacteriota bacterium]